jgi:hypothetical protein
MILALVAYTFTSYTTTRQVATLKEFYANDCPDFVQQETILH